MCLCPFEENNCHRITRNNCESLMLYSNPTSLSPLLLVPPSLPLPSLPPPSLPPLSLTVKVSQKLKEEQDRRLAGQQPPSNDSSHEGAPGSACSDQGGGGGGEREQRGIGAHSSGTLPKRSDAHLSCPACMTTVCIDCQQ